jgi:hypothetical protein
MNQNTPNWDGRASFTASAAISKQRRLKIQVWLTLEALLAKQIDQIDALILLSNLINTYMPCSGSRKKRKSRKK